MEDSESKIYYITDGDGIPGGYGDDVYIKIGYTTGDGKHRLETLQVGNPRPLFLLHTEPGGRELEREIHELCAQYKAKGEWFFYNEELSNLLWPSVRKRYFDRIDKMKEQIWIDEMEEIRAIKEKYEKLRDTLQIRNTRAMCYLMVI